MCCHVLGAVSIFYSGYMCGGWATWQWMGLLFMGLLLVNMPNFYDE